MKAAYNVAAKSERSESKTSIPPPLPPFTNRVLDDDDNNQEPDSKQAADDDDQLVVDGESLIAELDTGESVLADTEPSASDDVAVAMQRQDAGLDHNAAIVDQIIKTKKKKKKRRSGAKELATSKRRDQGADFMDSLFG